MDTLFMTKMAKIDTLFMTKTAGKKFCTGDQNFTTGSQRPINYAISRHENYTNNVKIQSHPPIGHFLFTFQLLWKYKTNLLLL